MSGVLDVTHEKGGNYGFFQDFPAGLNMPEEQGGGLCLLGEMGELPCCCIRLRHQGCLRRKESVAVAGAKSDGGVACGVGHCPGDGRMRCPWRWGVGWLRG